MKPTVSKIARLFLLTALAIGLGVGLNSEAAAQWGFYYNPANNTAGWQLGPYSTNYHWGPGYFYSSGTGPNGMAGNYFSSPLYTGWSHWNQGNVQGAFQTPLLNGGQPMYWSY